MWRFGTRQSQKGLFISLRIVEQNFILLVKYPLREHIHVYFLCTTVISPYISHVEQGGGSIITRRICILMVHFRVSYYVPVKLGLGW